ncbi:Multidrug efflux pump subunit AcrB [Singulisphaera sp. GP187]|uniref:efflux RND transporter permease subunit n=1 Tax=Singulisphaera sp. GP187 TaxID=1882752 RepID=UPI0009265519|nr:efflux RND transporter permease subunit [Singulisphaera sp. GP187]SIO60512.1 Multidrug efflux pump subunit AcrB [Singulisphaera sp. GP187]
MNSSLNPIAFAMRHPVSVMAGVAALAVASLLAAQRIAVDVFPALDLPVIYIAQPYGGMDPSQMESQLTSYYEGHSIYMTGIHHVESKNIQGMAVIKLSFYPGTDMGGAMAEAVGYTVRAKGFMPAGTLPPFILRYDTGSVPVGYLVFDSDRARSVSEMTDLALFRVRAIFGSIPGASAPPPVGGNIRSIVINLDPERLRAYRLSPDDVVAALSAGNLVVPSGNARIHDQAPMVPSNAMVVDPQALGSIPVRPGENLYIRDLSTITDAMDIATGYALVNGKRSIFLMVSKRADASTLAVVNALKANLTRMQEALPPDMHIRFELDQSPFVTRAMWGVGSEGLLGAALTGLMVLLFLRDWRSVVVVVLNIPLALMGALVALWATGQTINLMTLGGLSLAVGILVDEATVEVENIHSQMEHTDSVAEAVRRGNAETAVPRLLAMLCILAVFLPVFAMEGAVRNMFVPLALAVGFSMITSYVLSSMFVPVISVWLIRRHGVAPSDQGTPPSGASGRLPQAYDRVLRALIDNRKKVMVGYLVASVGTLVLVGSRVGREIFPAVDTGQFLVRLRAPTGTRIERTEEIARQALDVIAAAAGADAVEATVGFVGVTPATFPNQSVYLWTRGPEEAVLRIALRHDSGVRVEALKSRLRRELPERLGSWLEAKWRSEGLGSDEVSRRRQALRFSFEPADIVNEVMSFGSPTPVELLIHGPNLRDDLAYARKVRAELEKVPAIRDLQFGQAQDFPTVEVTMDRERAGLSQVTVQAMSRALLSATSSSRYVVQNFWADLASGNGYQVQVQVPPPRLDSAQEVGVIPVKQTPGNQVLLRDVARVREGARPGEYDRLDMRRYISLTANIEGSDLGRVATAIDRALDRAGPPPRGVRVDVRGQIEPMRQMFVGLSVGLVLSVVSIFLLLTAYFQSTKLALVSVAAVPAVLAGVAVMLFITGSTLNIQSFMGAIMAVGVAVANAILLVTFAERDRRRGSAEPAVAAQAAIEGARHRIRPVLMTSCAMLAGMVPMALALGEGGEQTAPLGRAVIGGLVAGTLTTLFVLPSVFAVVQARSRTVSSSIDPRDPESVYFLSDAGEPLDWPDSDRPTAVTS